MADRSLEDLEFWLPSKFLADEDYNNKLMDKAGIGAGFGANRFCFPSEFPYEFDSFGTTPSNLSSPVESVFGSTETESSDEEDFLAGLTRRLALSTQRVSVPSFTREKTEEKSRVMASSPQSTLSGVGSWSVSSSGSPNGPSQVSSPPTTPIVGKDDTWDLIYAAAGQVARLKMSGEGPIKCANQQSRGLLGPPRTPNHVPPIRNPNSVYHSNQSFPQNLAHTSQLMRPNLAVKHHSGSAMERQVKLCWQVQQQQQIQRRGCSAVGYDDRRCSRPLGLPQSSWPSLQQQQQQLVQSHQSRPAMRAVFLGGSGVKRECAGTGVFLPRRYNNPAPDSRKKSSCPTVLLPARVVQALNLNFEDMNIHPQPRFSPGFVPEYEMGRTNSVMTQQKRSLRPETGISHEMHLPQDWTY
ncbi:uncharacterized protein LOC110819390 [Carica papaya]|uniref:uncharacterized protein LOC110819390 n=1 Tax=Carica papaya TaxID=3649 RepID=UPI000B8CCC06|nr:uncharacterized protein LOC110819390 [Carica papaya]